MFQYKYMNELILQNKFCHDFEDQNTYFCDDISFFMKLFILSQIYNQKLEIFKNFHPKKTKC